MACGTPPLRNSSPLKKRVVIAPGVNRTLGRVRYIDIILTGNPKSQLSVFSLSLVDLSRTNLFNKILHGLTNFLLINWPTLAECTGSRVVWEPVQLRSGGRSACPRVAYMFLWFSGTCTVAKRGGCSRGFGGFAFSIANY
jgi:hypothetical protein